MQCAIGLSNSIQLFSVMLSKHCWCEQHAMHNISARLVL